MAINKLKGIRRRILKRAEDELEQVKQWRNDGDEYCVANTAWLSNALEHAHRAEALVEFLEVEFCGSVGGFGPGQMDTERSSIHARVAYLKSQGRLWE